MVARLLAVGLMVWLAVGTGASAQDLDEARELHLAGSLDEALEAYGRIVATDGADPAARATAGSNSCVILMNRGEFRLALERCEAALELGRSLDDPSGLARTLNNLGLVLQYLGRLDESEDRFSEALEINRRRDDVQAQVINLANLGVLAVSAGEYGRALALHGAAAELAAAHAEEEWAQRQAAVAELNRGGVLESVGSYGEALAAYRRAAESEVLLGPRGRATLQMNLGVVYRNLGDPVLAIESYEIARTTFRELEDRPGEANAWLNIGLANHLNLGALEAAEAAIAEALRMAQESGDRRTEILCLISMGLLRLDQGRTDEARTALEDGLRIAAASDSVEGRWSALSGLARVARVKGDLLEAREIYLQAIEQIEQDREGLNESSLRASHLEERRVVYAGTVDLLAELDRQRPGEGFAEEALQVAQRAKARDLLDVLGSGAVATDLPTVEDLRRRAGDGLTLEYFVGLENLHLWSLGEAAVELFDLGPYQPVLDRVAELHGDLAADRAIDGAVLNELSERLLGPVGMAIAAVSNVTVSADGGLFFLPFELLTDPATGAGPVVDRVEVRYLPSASSPPPTRERPADRRPAHLLLANPALQGGGAGRDSAVEELARRLRLPDLPAAEEEVAAILRWLPGEGRAATGKQATETFFRHFAPDGPRLVHFATHAVAETPSGLGAAILLASSEHDDGLLEPREIAALDCRAELTVLSACRTAMGPANRTGSLATLTGAFLAAGSSSVVATLWEVGDRTTAAFMDQFYYQLGRGLRPASALRKAKLALRADPSWNRPGLWAAYVLIGDAEPLVEESSRLPAVAIALGLLLVAVTAGWLIRRRASA